MGTPASRTCDPDDADHPREFGSLGALLDEGDIGGKAEQARRLLRGEALPQFQLTMRTIS